MLIDCILLAIVVVMAVYGYRKGFMYLVFGLAGIICVMLFSVPLAQMMSKILSNEWGITLSLRQMRILLVMGCGALIYIIVFAIGRFLHRTLVKGIEPAERTNKVLGALSGVLEAFVMIYFVFALASNIMPRIQEYAPSIAQSLSTSSVYQGIEHNNIIPKFDDMGVNILKKNDEINNHLQPSDIEQNNTVDKNGQTGGANKEPASALIKRQKLNNDGE